MKKIVFIVFVLLLSACTRNVIICGSDGSLMKKSEGYESNPIPLFAESQVCTSDVDGNITIRKKPKDAHKD